MLTDLLRYFLGTSYDEMDQENKRWMMLGSISGAILLVWIIIAVGGDTIEDIFMFGLFGGVIYLILSKGVKIRIDNQEIASVEPVIQTEASGVLNFNKRSNKIPKIVDTNSEDTAS